MSNGWFSKLRADGVIASGNAGIWVTPLQGEPVQVSPVGTMPVWAGQTLAFNHNDNTTRVGSASVPQGYNLYAGSDDGRWAGATNSGTGRVDVYRVRTDMVSKEKGLHSPLISQIPLATSPRFYGTAFGYLTPFLETQRALMIDGTTRATGVIMDWCADRTGAFYLYTIATGTYNRRIIDNGSNDVTIRTTQQDETALIAFTGPDGYPWMLSQTTNSGTFVRMIYSAFGYVIPGILDVPDARVIGSQLRVVGSDQGVPRNLWIDFAAPKVDLRTV